MRAKNADGLAGLDEESFVVFKTAKRLYDGVKTFPVARRFAASAIDDQILWALADFGIEIVHQHAESGFLLPAFAGNLRAARRALRRIGCVIFYGELGHRASQGKGYLSAGSGQWPVVSD